MLPAPAADERPDFVGDYTSQGIGGRSTLTIPPRQRLTRRLALAHPREAAVDAPSPWAKSAGLRRQLLRQGLFSHAIVSSFRNHSAFLGSLPVLRDSHSPENGLSNRWICINANALISTEKEIL